jgi:hypothetical protein
MEKISSSGNTSDLYLGGASDLSQDTRCPDWGKSLQADAGIGHDHFLHILQNLLLAIVKSFDAVLSELQTMLLNK